MTHKRKNVMTFFFLFFIFASVVLPQKIFALPADIVGNSAPQRKHPLLFSKIKKQNDKPHEVSFGTKMVQFIRFLLVSKPNTVDEDLLRDPEDPLP